MIEVKNFAYGRSNFFKVKDAQGLFKELNSLGFQMNWHDTLREQVCFEYTPKGGSVMFVGDSVDPDLLKYASKALSQKWLADMLAPHISDGQSIVIREIGRNGEFVYGATFQVWPDGRYTESTL